MTSESDILEFERERRRNILMRLLQVLAVVVVVLIIITLAIGSTNQAALMTRTLITSGELVGVVIAWLLARYKREDLATHVIFLAITATTAFTCFQVNNIHVSLPNLFIPIVGATLLLAPLWSFGYAGLSLLVTILCLSLVPQTPARSLSEIVVLTVLYAAYFGIIALLAYLSSDGYARLIRRSVNYATDLEHARADLEAQVEERTREIRQAMDDLHQSAETIQQLSAPVIPVADGVLAATLVGALDSQRATHLMQRVLDAVYSEHAHTLLIDLTGISIIDTQVAGALYRMAQAVQLLGARVILTGIRAEVAQTLVVLGVDLANIEVYQTLQIGLQHVDEQQKESLVI